MKLIFIAQISFYPILQQLFFCNPFAIHHIEKIKTPTEINFNSRPCIGNSDNPPTAPKTTTRGAVHAGHPGVNAANTPPNIAEEFAFTDFIVFILNAIIAKLIPASAEITIVNPTDAVM